VNVVEGTAKRLRYYCFKSEKSFSSLQSSPLKPGSAQSRDLLLMDSTAPFFRPRQKKTSNKDDIIIFKVERNIGRKLTPNGINKTTNAKN